MPRNTVKFSIFSFRVWWMLWSDKREMRCPTKAATKEIINASSNRTIWNLITPFLTAYSLRIVTRKLKSVGFSFLRWGIDKYGWKVSSIILKKWWIKDVTHLRRQLFRVLKTTVSPSGKRNVHEIYVNFCHHNFFTQLPYFHAIFSSSCGNECFGPVGCCVATWCRRPLGLL